MAEDVRGDQPSTSDQENNTPFSLGSSLSRTITEIGHEKAEEVSDSRRMESKMKMEKEDAKEADRDKMNKDERSNCRDDVEPVEGLGEWLRQRGLEDHIDEAIHWCNENGAVSIEEIFENLDDFCGDLGLEKEQIRPTLRRREIIGGGIDINWHVARGF